MKSFDYTYEETAALREQSRLFIDHDMIVGEVLSMRTASWRMSRYMWGVQLVDYESTMYMYMYCDNTDPAASNGHYHAQVMAYMPERRLHRRIDEMYARWYKWERQRATRRRRAIERLNERIAQWNFSPRGGTRYRANRTNRATFLNFGKRLAALLSPIKDNRDAILETVVREINASVLARYNANPLQRTPSLVNAILHKQGMGDVVAALNNARDRLTYGPWAKPVWHDEGWWCDSVQSTTHALHNSEEKDGMIAFAPSVDKLLRGVYTRTKPGRYLQKYFSNVLTADQIRYWSERQQMVNSPMTVHFIDNTDPEGWEWVYENSVFSCMRYNRSARYIDSGLYGVDHPVRVYAYPGNGLRLAYVFEPGSERERGYYCDSDEYIIAARAIVNDNNKGIVRIYAEDDRIRTEFREQLERAGYSMNNGCLDGVRIHKRGGPNGGYIMPYIDGVYTDVEDEGGYFVIGSRGRCAQNSGGCIRGDSTECPCCGNERDDDDMVWVEYEDQSICQGCIDRNYVDAVSRRGDTILMHEACEDLVFCEGNSTYYDRRYIDYYSDDVEFCSQDGALYLRDELVWVDGELVHESHCVKLDYPHNDEDYALKYDTTTLPDGKVCHDDDVEDILAEHYADEGDESTVHDEKPAVPFEAVKPLDPRRHTMSTFKTGDRVRIVRRVERCNGWHNGWTVGMDGMVDDGKVYEVTSVGDMGVRLSDTVYGWPWTALAFADEMVVADKENDDVALAA